MLDFYLALSASDFAAESPDEARYLGGIGLEQHRALEKVLAVCEQRGFTLHHYEDAAFTADQTKALLACLRANAELSRAPPAAAAAFGVLEELVGRAVAANAGIRTFCD